MSALNQPPAPIGVFDSGIGGLSVLKALRAELPHEDFVYIADSGFAPYGERSEDFVVARSRAITGHLLQGLGQPIKALVVACNTATAAAIYLLRQAHPQLPIIGVEPALKPAVAASRTQRIGVLATRGTLASHKFKVLLASLQAQAAFSCQPCDGLADAIERDEESKIRALCAYYIRATGQFGINPGEIDTLVLGCTHYPFARAHLQDILPPGVQVIDNGEPVARQARRRLTQHASADHVGQVVLYSTGDAAVLTQAATRWLGLSVAAQPLCL